MHHLESNMHPISIGKRTVPMPIARAAMPTRKNPTTTRFQAELSPRAAAALDSLKADLDIRSNAELLCEAVAVLQWLVRERRNGRTLASFNPDQQPVRELVSQLLERAAPEYQLPPVPVEWTQEQLARLAASASAEPAAPTDALVRAMKRR
jgi:hypothetical protein